jgi:carbonic anhydrase/acetyltransferase-like protein (isoleucine patch superfamily)
VAIEGDVVTGHQAVIGSQRIGRGTLTGIGVILLGGVRIGRKCLIAPGSPLTLDTVIPDDEVVVEFLGQVLRDTIAEDRRTIERVAARYIESARQDAAGQFRWPC